MSAQREGASHMSAPGRPKREYRSAPGRPKREYWSAQREGVSQFSAQREGARNMRVLQ